MPDRVFNLLFLCTGDSARSILAGRAFVRALRYLGNRLSPFIALLREIGEGEGASARRPEVA